jgi:TATA-box binding protein (TBP) (component of TFIID and TFIIIB)
VSWLLPQTQPQQNRKSCLSNVVLTCTYDRNLDLPKVAWALSAEYNPSVFAAAQLRLVQPGVVRVSSAS